MNHHHGDNHTGDYDCRQGAEDDLAPFNANPISLLTIAAAINLGSQEI
jgi:hypothetical protein